MVKNTTLLISLIASLPSSAVENREFYKLADSVLKGGTSFNQEDIRDVSVQKNIPIHHRAIIEVAMLASVEEEPRYHIAISKATDYIGSGDVDWAKGYLQMQRGFLYGLLGDRDKGTKDLVAVLESERLSSINFIPDPLLDIMRKRTRDLSLDLDSLMKQTVGNYYMDFRKEGALPAESFRFFSLIKSPALRDKCLLQLKNRVGADEYEKITQSVKASDLNSKKISGPHENKSVYDERIQDLKLQGSPDQLRKNEIESEPSNHLWYLGMGLILGIGIASFFVSIRRSQCRS